MKHAIQKYRIQPGAKVKLSDYDPGDTSGADNKDEAEASLPKLIRRAAELQNVLYAEGKQSLLVVLQAMDAAGKDGTISHIFSGINPQGCSVTSFKAPSKEDLAHDFLWRVHRVTPAKGMIGIFNRSHYEDVLIVRVHNLVPKQVWKKRYDHINAFEDLLSDNQTKIVKFFLHISKDEQKERLEARIADKSKHWKVNPDDLVERQHWDEYMEAYEDVLSKCSTSQAPWYVVPANKKWYRNYFISHVLVNTLEEMNPSYPEAETDVSNLVVK